MKLPIPRFPLREPGEALNRRLYKLEQAHDHDLVVVPRSDVAELEDAYQKTAKQMGLPLEPREPAADEACITRVICIPYPYLNTSVDRAQWLRDQIALRIGPAPAGYSPWKQSVVSWKGSEVTATVVAVPLGRE